jgi:glycosyltransferase involved in cell wall biosynthesis
MRPAYFAIPGDLAAPTGGYEYARQLLHAVPTLRHMQLPGGFPNPSEADLAVTADLLAGLSSDAVVLVDGLAFGALPERCLEPVRAAIVALVHHPLCLEAGLSVERAAALTQSERQALTHASRVIATSASTAGWLATMFDVPVAKLSVAEPGTEKRARAQPAGGPTRLLSVGAVTPRKGYNVLVAALAGLVAQDWRLSIVGDLSRNCHHVGFLRAAIENAGLAGRITLEGAVDEARLESFYATADIFVSASLHEGYGMAVASAMAHGLPLVATDAGALADTVPPGASLPCQPGDMPSLRVALARMLDDPALRASCGAASWAGGQALPDWHQTAAQVAAILELFQI